MNNESKRLQIEKATIADDEHNEIIKTMTPKEKANELVSKYKNAPFNCTDCDMPFCDIPCTRLSLEESKQCALIAVDEILQNVYDDRATIGRQNLTDKEYWKQVKQEIEKL